MLNYLNSNSVSFQIACLNQSFKLIIAVFRENLINLEEISFKLVYPETIQINRIQLIQTVKDAYLLIYNELKRDQLLGSKLFLIKKNGDELAIKHPTDLFEYLRPTLRDCYPSPNATEQKWNKLLHFSSITVDCEFLSLEHLSEFENELESICAIKKHKTLWSYVINEIDYQNSFLFFNRYSAFYGHPTLPFSKLKHPVSAPSIVKYSPEFGNNVDIVFAAFRKDILCIQEVNECNLIKTEFGELFAKWEKNLKSLNLNPEDFYPFLIHPLNMKFILKRYSNWIEQNIIILNSNLFMETNATLSFRSMIPKENKTLCLKLALNMQTTSQLRTIDITELNYGIQVSTICKRLLEISSNFDQTLYISQNLSVVCLKEDGININYIDAEKTSYLIRESPNKLLKENEISMPLAGMFIRSPITDKIFICDILKGIGLDSFQNALEYFKEYCMINLRGFLGLFLKFGFVIEAHQQNINLIFDKNNGKLTKIFYHDLIDNIKVFKPIFELTPFLLENDNLFRNLHSYDSSLKACVSQIFHCPMFHNLIPLAYILSREYKVDSSQFLQLIKDSMKQIFMANNFELKSNIEHLKIINEVKDSILDQEFVYVGRRFGKMYEQSLFDDWFDYDIDDFTRYDNLRTADVQILNPLHAKNNK